MSPTFVLILLTVIGASYAGRDVCMMPPPLRGSERVYRTEAEHISGSMGKRQMLLGLFPIHKVFYY